MGYEPLSRRVKARLMSASQRLRTADPAAFVGPLIEDSFAYPPGDLRYASNAFSPGAAPFGPVFGSAHPRSLSFNMEPLGPDASGGDRRDAASREMRRLVDQNFGRDALHWFDGASEGQRGAMRSSSLNYGAFFGSSFDNAGLQSATVTYEGGNGNTVNPQLARLITAAMAALPGARPIFTTLVAGRDYGSQWITLMLSNGIRIIDLQPMMEEFGLGAKLSQILQVLGIALGGRFDLPPGSALVSLGRGPEGVEMELQVMLDVIPDVPPNFLQLLTMNLRERPSELAALERFMEAFTPDNAGWPGRFSILGVKIKPQSPPRVSLFLRPVELEITSGAAMASQDVQSRQEALQ